jgi:hypothetical protein
LDDLRKGHNPEPLGRPYKPAASATTSSEMEATGLLDAYFARQVGGSTVAPTVAHPEEVAA